MADGVSGKMGWRYGAVGAVAAVVVIAVVAGAAYVMGWRVSHQAQAASCLADDAIDSGTRKTLDQAALDFVSVVSGANPIGAYAMLAADTKGAITPDKFLAALRPSLEPVAPFTDVHVAHAYLVHAAPGGAGQRVICGNIDQPENWVAVTAKPIPDQAHLVVDAEAKQGHWAFVLWLVPENGWHIEGFNFTATGMAGKSLAEILEIARVQHAQNHEFNAVLLYGAAARLASRGNDLQLGIETSIQEQLAKLPVPAFLKGKPPLTWKIGDEIYKIDSIGAAGVGDKIYLAITQILTPWHSDNDADTRNRMLLRDFVTAVPEYSASFGGLILMARDETGGHLYRTVATNKAPDETKAPAKK